MMYSKKVYVALLLATLSLGGIATVASAAENNGMMRGSMQLDQRGMMPRGEVGREGEGRGAEMGMRGMMGQIFGTVSSVNSPSFTLEMGTSTRTLAITTTSTTTFMKDAATASFGDVTVGSRVVVRGKLDAAKTTLVAERVQIVTNVTKEIQGMMRPEDMREYMASSTIEHHGGMMGSTTATGTPRFTVRGMMGSLFKGFMHFFGR